MKFYLLIFAAFCSCAFASEIQFIKNLESGKSQKIVVYGTSLTAKGPWVPLLQNKLKEKYSENVSLINSGGSGKDSNWGLTNLQKKVIDHKPNTVFIEFGMNDAVVRFKNSKDKIRSNISSMISQIQKSLPNCEIILMTMNPAFGIPKGHRSERSDLNGYYEIYRQLAKEKQLMIIDHCRNWQTLLAKAGVAYKEFIPDGIHPNKAGCEKVTIPEMVKVLGLK